MVIMMMLVGLLTLAAMAVRVLVAVMVLMMRVRLRVVRVCVRVCMRVMMMMVVVAVDIVDGAKSLERVRLRVHRIVEEPARVRRWRRRR